MTAAAGRALFSGGGVQVVQVDRGRCAVLRFVGASSGLLVEWAGRQLRGV